MVDFENVKLLELFAGTGNIGYEFASRGCPSITSVDLNFHCIQFIKKINKELSLNNKVIRSDAFRFIKSNKGKYNFIFADPPYELAGLNELIASVFDKSLLSQEGVLILEHSKMNDFSENSFFKNTRRYGNVNFSFFEWTSDE